MYRKELLNSLIQCAKVRFPAGLTYYGKFIEEELKELEKFCEIKCPSVYMDGTAAYSIHYKKDIQKGEKMFGMKKKLIKPDEKYQLKATVEDIVKLYKDSAMARGIYVQKDAEEFLKILHPSLYQNLDEIIEGKELSPIEVYKGMTLKEVQEKIFYNFPLTFLCILAISKEVAGKEGFEELWNYSNLC